jgi:hypothetical protein
MFEPANMAAEEQAPHKASPRRRLSAISGRVKSGVWRTLAELQKPAIGGLLRNREFLGASREFLAARRRRPLWEWMDRNLCYDIRR